MKVFLFSVGAIIFAWIVALGVMKFLEATVVVINDDDEEEDLQ